MPQYSIEARTEIVRISVAPEVMKNMTVETIRYICECVQYKHRIIPSHLSLFFAGADRIVSTKSVIYNETDVWFCQGVDLDYWGFYLPKNNSRFTSIIVHKTKVQTL